MLWIGHESSVRVSGDTKSLWTMLENFNIERDKFTDTLSKCRKMLKMDKMDLEK